MEKSKAEQGAKAQEDAGIHERKPIGRTQRRMVKKIQIRLI